MSRRLYSHRPSAIRHAAGSLPTPPRALFLGAVAHLTVLTALLATGCREGASTMSIDIPTMPHPMPGQATLGGHVRDANGQAVSGATVKIAETGAKTTSDASGAYQLAVPSDSTLTLTATATGTANTFRESVVLAAGSAISDFDVLLLPIAQITAINMLGPAAQVIPRGVMAVRLHVMGSACVPAGAHVTVYPTTAATVVYSAKAASSGGLDMPDRTVQDVQAGTQIAVWLAAVMPPGNMNLLQIDVQKAGCQLMPQSPSLGGLMFPGLRQVAATSLSEADLFLQ
jgi:Carboxypeptidase regulatory-like domain